MDFYQAERITVVFQVLIHTTIQTVCTHLLNKLPYFIEKTILINRASLGV